jgi:hypothetical protein
MKLFMILLDMCAALSVTSHALLAQNTAQVQGIVTEDTGQTIAGALVTLHRAPQFAPVPYGKARGKLQNRVAGDPNVDVSTTSGSGGSFAFAGLPAGMYILCAAVPQSSYLPTCDWSRTISFSLSTGEIHGSQQIRVARGATLCIRVNDPIAALSPADTIASTRIAVGIGTPSGAFYNTPIVAKDGSGRDHSLVVPFDTPLFVWCSSRMLQVSDESGRPIGKLGSPTYFSIPSSTPNKTFVFNITGIR